MNTENLSTLKIHKLTQEQYDRELAAGNINANEMYLTPEEEIDLSGYSQIGHTHTTTEIKSGAITLEKRLTNMAAATETVRGEVVTLANSFNDQNFSPVGHTHTATSITSGNTTLEQRLTTMQRATSALQDSVFSLTNFKADAEHDHYTSDIIYSDANLGDIRLGEKLSNMDSATNSLSGIVGGLVTSVGSKADANHTHSYSAEDISLSIEGNNYRTVHSYLEEFVDPEIKDLFDKKANVDHEHSYSAADISLNIAGNGYTNVGDYLESVDEDIAKLVRDVSNKADKSHEHSYTAADISTDVENADTVEEYLEYASGQIDALWSGKASTAHDHDSEYTYGVKRTFYKDAIYGDYLIGNDPINCTLFTTDNNTEKMYSILIASTAYDVSNNVASYPEEQVCTTVFFDWRMIPHGGHIKLYYTFEAPSSTAGFGYVSVIKNADGIVSFELTNKDHRIRHICGYV